MSTPRLPTPSRLPIVGTDEPSAHVGWAEMTSNAATTPALPVAPGEPGDGHAGDGGTAGPVPGENHAVQGREADSALPAGWRVPRAWRVDLLVRRLGAAGQLTQERMRAIAVTARFAAVLVPVSVVLGTATSLDASGRLGAAILISVIWFATLESAFAAARLSPLALGVPVATAIGTLMGVPVVALVAFAVPPLDRLRPGEVLAMAIGVFLVSAASGALVNRTLGLRRRVLVVGASNGGGELVRELTTRRDVPFECVGAVVDDASAANGTSARVLGSVEELGEVVAREQPDIVVLGSPHSLVAAFDQLLDVVGLDFRVVGAPEFYEHAFGRVPVRHLSPVWFMSVLHLYQRPYSRMTKRILDVVGATAVLVLTLPVLELAAFVVRVSSSGPVLFRQVRLGESGKTFEMLKFRTMVDGAEEPGEAIWAAERDPRITPIGRVLRKTRIDEFPQLWNVLRNEMSLIGPRPERPEFVELLEREVPFWTRRHLVKPGVTGWAQVSNGYTADAEGTAEKLSYDLYYLKHRSLVLDLAIIAKTVKILLSGAGAR